MNNVSINLENCYGVKKLTHNFDFSKSNMITIYAPNGTMKTSFTKTFLDLSNGKMPREEIHNLTPICNIKMNNNPIKAEDIFVIESNKNNYESENSSNLLVDKNRKLEYDNLVKGISRQIDKLNNKLNKHSGISKSSLENYFSNNMEANSIIDYIKDLNLEEFSSLNENDLSNVKYNEIFNENVYQLLENNNFVKNLENYSKKCDELFKKNKFYKKGIFNPNKADSVFKNLKKENFFKAENRIKLKNISKLLSEDDFENKLKESKKEIFENDKLQEIYNQLSKNNVVKSFQELIEKNPEILLELKKENLIKFKQKLWQSYLIKEIELVKSIFEEYYKSEIKIKEIIEEAKKQKTLWEEVKEEFENRFIMPFKLDIINKHNSILGLESPNIIMKFEDDKNYKELNYNELSELRVLSRGEEKVWYLLNILYDINSISAEKKLIIIDDIADSFDYKNKYVIIQYLKDISKNTNFNIIVLTHNFDFFRTIQRRILDTNRWSNAFRAIKKDNGIELINAGNWADIDPLKKWKMNLSEDKCKIACIPFIRNLIEYDQGTDNDDFQMLTNAIHEKNDSSIITVNKINDLFNKRWKSNLDENNPMLIHKYIFNCAEKICNDPDETKLENKIVLAIGCRLNIEKYMFSVGSDKSLINDSQTGKLFEKFKKEFSKNKKYVDIIKLIDSVIITTPEFIHLNTFMYEPLIDISCDCLKDLYKKTSEINKYEGN